MIRRNNNLSQRSANSDISPAGAPVVLRFVHALWQRAAPVLVGVFFLFQCWHMFIDNVTHMEETTQTLLKRSRTKLPATWEVVRSTPDVGPRLDEWVMAAEDADPKPELSQKHAYERKFHRWYGQLLVQEQSWSLFAPDVGTSTTFVAVQLRWDSPEMPQIEWLEDPRREIVPLPGAEKIEPAREPVLLLSENEPADIHSYLRVGKFRLRRYEGQIDVTMTRRKDEERQKYLDRWTDRIRQAVSRDGDCMLAYLNWRFREWRAANPDAPLPTQVLLLGRTWVIPEPPGPHPWDWDFQGMRPIARWLPQEKPNPNYYPLERYLPSSGYYLKREK